MPNPDGAITPEERTAIVNWLKEKGVGVRCRSCNQAEMTLEGKLGYVGVWTGSPFPPSVFPYAILVCGRCAFTAFYNTVIIGLTPRAAPKPPVPPLPPSTPAQASGGSSGG